MMDFANIKNIVTPKGEVAMISRGDEILWQKVKYKRELLYLEGTGTQWLDIGETINTATDTVELVFQNKEANVYRWIFGEHDSTARFALGSGDGANKRNVAYGVSTYKVADTQQYNTKHTFVANEGGVFIDGTKVAGFSSFVSTSTLYLFNLNLSSGNYVASAKIWGYKQTRNGELIHDIVPVLDTNDVPCMYDKVSGKLFYNKGTGQFKYAELPRLPLAYQEVEYIESTGKQYIDTGIKLTNNYSVTIDYQITSIPKSGERKGLFGGLEANVARYGSLVSPTTRMLEFGYGVGNTYYQTAIPDTNRHVIEQKKNKVYIDNSLIYTFEKATFTMSTNAPLGTFNYVNYTPILARYFSSKWWNGDTLVRDFIPCYRKSDGKAGMYDLVTGTFFTNSGTGEFLYG